MLGCLMIHCDATNSNSRTLSQAVEHADLYEKNMQNLKVFLGLCDHQVHRMWGLAEQTFLAEEAKWRGNLKLCLASLYNYRNLLDSIGEFAPPAGYNCESLNPHPRYSGKPATLKACPPSELISVRINRSPLPRSPVNLSVWLIQGWHI
jgi:hypothetical protein